MSVWRRALRLLSVDDTVANEQFSLDADASHHPKTDSSDETDDSSSAPEEQGEKGGIEHCDSESSDLMESSIVRDLHRNRYIIEQLFHIPTNKDVVVREFQIASDPPLRAILVFVDGLADKTIINTHILEPLMILRPIRPDASPSDKLGYMKDALVPGNQVDVYETFKDVVKNVLAGSTAMFVEGCDRALLVETKGWEHRTVSTTQTESVVRGPQDAFTESFRANTGLVRSKFRSKDLVTEMLSVGTVTTTDVAVLYVQGLTNPSLVTEVKRRIKAIKVDYLADSGVLEQFIEDDPPGFLPRIMSTERPDRVAHFLSEGHVAILIGQSPFALIAPISAWALLHTSEDAYLRWPFGGMLRLIRLISVFAGLLLPALYIATSNFHPEMIPTGLMIAIAASRETVPFPVVLEVMIMEFSIELIREAGIRIPSAIGPTIGIVGALILGQAAVQAGIVSPILVIVVAVTALASFTMPNYNLSLTVRMLRFIFLLAAAALGFYGIILVGMVLIMYLARLRSFGVPMLSPIAPYRHSSPDVILRGRIGAMGRQSPVARPRDERRQARVTRPWSPWTRDSREALASASRDRNDEKGEDPT